MRELTAIVCQALIRNQASSLLLVWLSRGGRLAKRWLALGVVQVVGRLGRERTLAPDSGRVLELQAAEAHVPWTWPSATNDPHDGQPKGIFMRILAVTEPELLPYTRGAHVHRTRITISNYLVVHDTQNSISLLGN